MIMQSLPDPALDLFLQAAQGKKALDILVIDLRGMTVITDFFLICSGRSSRQVMAIADHIQSELRNHRIKPLGVEGAGSGHWILLDFDHVVVHVFYDPVRRFYNLEGLWADAPSIQVTGPDDDLNNFSNEGDDTDDPPDVFTYDS